MCVCCALGARARGLWMSLLPGRAGDRFAEWACSRRRARSSSTSSGRSCDPADVASLRVASSRVESCRELNNVASQLWTICRDTCAQVLFDDDDDDEIYSKSRARSVPAKQFDRPLMIARETAPDARWRRRASLEVSQRRGRNGRRRTRRTRRRGRVRGGF